MAFANAANMIRHHDARLLASLLSDTGVAAQINDANPILSYQLDRASADILSHALRGGIYSNDDINSLAAANDPFLIGLTCDLCTGYLYRRRGMKMPEAVALAFEAAETALKDLSAGKRVMNVAGTVDATLPSTKVISQATRGQLQLISDSQWFPQRRTRLF